MKIEEPKSHDLAPHLWVDKYADYLYGYACVRIDDRDLARDLVQETFLAALEGVEKFDGRSSEKTWLTAILKNKIYDVYRKKSSRQNKQQIEQITMKEADEFFDSDSGHWREEHYPLSFGVEQPDALENKELQHVLKSCIKKLPPLWKSVFTMKHIDEESSEAICSELKLTPSNFWVIIHRAKVNLRACLQRNWI
ncbi:sigma-70 family RNA polymerase sigma factor [Sphingobacterium mizutaii]|uniref:sigma-70 family RNA polymerase sigma factor n=1 Tax=Sphingobacterium mizutaii TaxID=1010 RepID=UPI0016268577|nr:sigma-70 family RNA polymerase sigma factor [Sphingobacterium mizutaii]